MSGYRVRIDYDEMADVARRFGQQADVVREMIQQLRRCSGALENGGWIGCAADAFYAEMNEMMFPALDRLVNALDASQEATNRLIAQYRQAEEEGAGLFHGDSATSNTTTGSGTASDGGQPGGESPGDSGSSPASIFDKIKDVAEVLVEMKMATFEQFQIWANSIGVVDEYVQSILYYQDDAMEILAVSEEWTRTLVQFPIKVESGWGAFFGKLTDVGPLDKAFLGLDFGFTTWEYWDKGLFTNPEYYAALTTDLAFFGATQVGLATIAGIGLVGTPAIVATGVVVGGLAVVNWVWGDDITEGFTPAYQWIGSQLDGAKNWFGQQLSTGGGGAW